MLRRHAVAVMLLATAAGGCADGESRVAGGPTVHAPRLDRPQLAAFRAVAGPLARGRVGGPRYALVVGRADGKGIRVVVGGSSRSGTRPALFERVAWAPDGRRLAFTAEHGPVPATDDTDIWIVRPDGSGLRRLTSNGRSFHPVWTPDGRRIYFAHRPKRHPADITFPDGSRHSPVWIWSMRPDGSDRRAVSAPVKGRYEVPESFSRDGDTLAFTRGTYVQLDDEGRERNTREVWVMRPDGSDAHKLAGRAQAPAFSPDGRRIAFASDRDGNGSLTYGDRSFFANELYLMDADGSDVRRLTRTEAMNEAQPSWIPSGTRLAYQRGATFQNAEATAVMQANADGRCVRRVFLDAGRRTWYRAPAWRPGDARRGDRALRCSHRRSAE